MSRPFAFSLAAIAVAAFGCAPRAAEVARPDVAIDIATTTVDRDEPRTDRLPVAPMPHLPGEGPDRNLTTDDLGIDSKLQAALPDLSRIDPHAPLPVLQDPDPPDRDPQPKVNPAVPSVNGRSDATRSRLIRQAGGNAASEAAVASGLAWLAKQQQKDGGWAFDAGAMKDDTAAATGLALLPFLGAGETHQKKDGKYTDAVKAGVQWLVKNLTAKGADAGKFEGGRTATGQALATLALVEAYSLTKDPALKAPAQLALDYLQKKQDANGSWPDDGADRSTSLVGWPVRALKAAKLNKELVVDDKVIARVAKFLDATAAGSRKSMYGHKDATDAAPGTAPTAVGLLCRYDIAEWGPNHVGMIEGVAGLVKHPPVGRGAVKDLYYYYHATQVVYFYEGEDWKTWNEGPKQPDGSRTGGMRDWLVNAHNKKDANLGSWEPEQGWFGSSCGRLGTTAMAVLTLDVYYRSLPRPNGDKAIKIIE